MTRTYKVCTVHKRKCECECESCVRHSRKGCLCQYQCQEARRRRALGLSYHVICSHSGYPECDMCGMEMCDSVSPKHHVRCEREKNHIGKDHYAFKHAFLEPGGFSYSWNDDGIDVVDAS